MFRISWWMPLAVFVPAFVLRLWGVESARNPVEDMYMHVQNAFYYSGTGLLGPDNWWTPPAKHLLLRAGLGVFGNDVLGWRLPGVLFGSAAVVVVALIARRVFRTTFPALAAAVILALDPLSIAFSRTTFEDTAAVFFLLLSVLFWLRALEEPRLREQVLFGAFVGVAVSLRWYATIPMALMLGVTGFLAYRQGRNQPSGRGALLVLACATIVVPVIMYLVWWIPWFGRGYSLGDWAALQLDAFRVQGAGFAGFNPALSAITGPARWFTSWVGIALQRSAASGGHASLVANDPIVWFLFVPAVGYQLVRALRDRRSDAFVLAAIPVLLYGFFLISPRPILLYSALTVVPFGGLALAHALDRLPCRAGWLALGALSAWGLYLYPLASGLARMGPYAWILERVTVIGGAS